MGKCKLQTVKRLPILESGQFWITHFIDKTLLNVYFLLWKLCRSLGLTKRIYELWQWIVCQVFWIVQIHFQSYLPENLWKDDFQISEGRSGLFGRVTYWSPGNNPLIWENRFSNFLQTTNTFCSLRQICFENFTSDHMTW